MSNQAVDESHNVVGVNKRHFEVQLRELRLTVSSQVLIAKATGNLHVTVVAGDHQDLLVQLRRLRQRVEATVMDAAGHQVIAGALGRAPAEHRRFNVDKPMVVEELAHAQGNTMPQQHCSLHFGAAQIEIAILQPQIFVGQFQPARLKRWRLALVEQNKPGGPNLNFTGGQFGIDGPLGSRGHFPGHGDHEFAAQRSGQLLRLDAAVGVKRDLRLAVAVAQVDENNAAMVAVAINPAANRDFLANVPRVKFAARMSPHQRHISQSRFGPVFALVHSNEPHILL